MGWDSSYEWETRADVVSAARSDLAEGHTVIASAVTKSGLWAVVQAPSDVPYIALTLIECEAGRWYTKGMSECMHPYYYDCPVEFLALAPVENPEWRSKVCQYWQDKKAGDL